MHLTPVAQLGAGLGLLALLAWSTVATVGVIGHKAEMEEAGLTRAAIERAWESRHRQLEETHAALLRDHTALERDHRAAIAALGEAQAELVTALAELRAANIERQALKRGVEDVQAARALAAERAETAEDALHEARLAMLREAAGLPSVASGGAGPALPETALGAAMAEVIAERDAAIADVAALDARIAALNGKIEGWRDRQDLVLGKVEDAVRTGLTGLSGMLERADIDIDKILEETRASYAGSGGPFVPLADDEAAMIEDDETDLRIAALMSDLERVNLLRIAVDRLPFGRPVIGARLTSAFGKRRDPFRGRWSMHNGVDYAGPRGTPIEVTADGVVSFSGRMRGYGNIVIVKHAFGYETRYAHLTKRLVKKGERVERGQRIGLMGSTGRSTGSHLHYEIRIDEDPINPAKFIEAARHVL